MYSAKDFEREGTDGLIVVDFIMLLLCSLLPDMAPSLLGSLAGRIGWCRSLVRLQWTMLSAQ
jgi:hypothetical protein